MRKPSAGRHLLRAATCPSASRLVLPLLWLCCTAGLARPKVRSSAGCSCGKFSSASSTAAWRFTMSRGPGPRFQERVLAYIAGKRATAARLPLVRQEGLADGGDFRKSPIRAPCRCALGKASSLPVDYTQAAKEKVALVVGTGEKAQSFRAADLWQLALAYPTACKQHLTPLLLKLRPGRSLTDMSARIEAKLLTLPGDEMAARRLRWGKLVAQLGDERFGKREAADRALRSDGPAVAGYLRRLDYRRLDAEQQFRIQRILDVLVGRDDDSIEVAAATLAEEPMVWLILLGRPERLARQVAAAHLASLLGHRIDVDPAAGPETQKDKLERLRARIEAATRPAGLAKERWTTAADGNHLSSFRLHRSFPPRGLPPPTPTRCPMPHTASPPARYVVGFDLGTTNSAAAYVDTEATALED